jgi:hypothetical protein
MSLEQKIEALTAALEANTAALTKSVGGASGGTTTKTKKDEPKGYAAKHSVEEMQAALQELKDKAGAPVAKGIVKEVGGKEKMAEITDPETIDKVYEAAKNKLKEHDDGM